MVSIITGKGEKNKRRAGGPCFLRTISRNSSVLGPGPELSSELRPARHGDRGQAAIDVDVDGVVDPMDATVAEAEIAPPECML